MEDMVYIGLLSMAKEREVEVIKTNTFQSFKCYGLYVIYESLKVIFLEQSLGDLALRNFILAHELGHHDLGHDKQEDKNIEQMEEEADLYAYKLLGQLKSTLI